MTTSAGRYSATRTAIRTAAIMLVFTLLFTALMAFTYTTTRPAIETAMQQEQMRLINDILPPTLYDNTLLEDYLFLPPSPVLGTTRPGRVWRARQGDTPTALIIETAAEDGYSGRIHLIVALDSKARVLGVRVTAHKETPGLGDYIDPKKDRNKTNPWINQFAGASPQTIPPPRWTVTKDGGAFDYHTGATISARAIAKAIGRATGFALMHRDALFDTPSGETLQGTVL